MESKERIERTLDVSGRIDQVKPSERFLDRLHAIPEIVKEQYDKTPKKVVWSVAASIAILVILNVFIFSRSERSNQNQNTIEESYFSYMKQL